MYFETVSQVEHNFKAVLDEIKTHPVGVTESEESDEKVAVIISFDEYERMQAMEDYYWAEKAERAHKKGYIGKKASQQLIQDILNARH